MSQIKLNEEDIFYSYEETNMISSVSGYYYKRGKGKTYKYRYIKNICTFDIEATTWVLSEYSEKPFSSMYIWQLCLDGTCFYGRTWDEFLEFVDVLKDKYQLDITNRLVIFVHNLSYEWEFLKSFFHPITDLCWINAKNAPVKVVTEEGIEFRCSYILSNMSLKKFCENTQGVLHGKLVGDLDYRIHRHSQSPISVREMEYCFNDVMGLYECLRQRLGEEKNGYFTLPITSTSYVRRDLREEIGDDRKYKDLVRALKPDLELYDILVKLFRGGNTHANRFYIGQCMEGIGSMDLTSSYPFQMVYRKFPMKPFLKEKIFLLRNEEYFKRCLTERACVIEAVFEDLDLKSAVPIPYISSSRANHYSREGDAQFDNGRIVKNKYVEMYCTEIDFKIILDQYNFSRYSIVRMWTAEKDYLPDHVINNLMRYYDDKTKLKGVKGKEYEYGKQKNRLNGNYGMCCTNTLKDCVTINADGEYIPKQVEDREKALNDAYKQGFLAYQWGVWISAYGRLQLQDAINITGMDTVYVDTDSDKFRNPEKYMKAFEEYNKKIISKAKVARRRISAKSASGQDVYMGTFDNDGQYFTFATWGAKKYAYCSKIRDTKYCDLHITVAGASKKRGATAIAKRIIRDRYSRCEKYIKRRVKARNFDTKLLFAITQEEAKQLNHYFRIGLVLDKNESGRTVAYRHGKIGKVILLDDFGNLSEEEVVSGVGIVETTYSLGITTQFEKFLSGIGVQIYD